MTNLTQEQIANEFKRHVSLCCGIGRIEMIEIIDRFYSDKDPRSIVEQLAPVQDRRAQKE